MHVIQYSIAAMCFCVSIVQTSISEKQSEVLSLTCKGKPSFNPAVQQLPYMVKVC